jgi:beta-xylosidase
MKRLSYSLAVASILGMIGWVLTRPSDATAQDRDQARNPVIWADVPDPSVIRVGDVYYMASTTMHMSPGVPIMRSANLVDWEIVGYVYDEMANADALHMRQGQNAYGRGSWAPSLRYHDGVFYVVTFSYTTGETYVFTTEEIDSGPWQRSSLSALYHDPSLFFDADGRVYLVYGAGDIRIVELTENGRAVKPGGIHRVLIPASGAITGSEFFVPGEGVHLYHLNGYYYAFIIAWPTDGMRTQVVHRAENLDGPWEARTVLHYEGIAQGGIVDTPDGEWYALLFGDRGAVGRIPYLIPMQWEDDWPVLGVDGRVPELLDIPSSQKGVGGIVSSDEFDRNELGLAWQWNHNPVNHLWSLTERPGFLRLTTGRTDPSFVDARNTLTQRTFGPTSAATTFIDASNLNDGDVAGLGLLAAEYGFVGVTRANGAYAIAMTDAAAGVVERIPLDQTTVYLRAEADFRDQTDRATFAYSLDGDAWHPIGRALQMRYTLDHFMGYRFALFNFATETPGGRADFGFFRLDGLRR